MICDLCRKSDHLNCPAILLDVTWCDCHHRSVPKDILEKARDRAREISRKGNS